MYHSSKFFHGASLTRYESSSMIINIRSKQFDSVTLLLIYDSRFYASTYDCPNHCLLTMVIVAGRKFVLMKQTLNPIIKQWVTPQQWWHCCSCSSIMSCMSALQPAGSSHGWDHCCLFFIGSLHVTFCDDESQPAGRKISGWLESDVSMSYI